MSDPLARQGAEAMKLRPDDPELIRVRRLLAALRPDLADPWEPPPPTESPSHLPGPRDPMAAWGGVPRGVGFGTSCRDDDSPDAPTAARVLVSIGDLPPLAARTLEWLRDHATLRQGIRGLYVDCGINLASVDVDDIGARREAAYLVGRRLVLGAATAWGI